jgi:hypothetical protein
MSHVATGKCRIFDLDALEQAASAVGLELVRDQKTYKWFGAFLNDSQVGRDAVKQGARPADFGKCEHALRLKDHKPGDYEIGIKPALDGKGYRLEYDQWGHSGRKLAAAVGGTDAEKLQDQYNLAVAMRSLVRQGYRVRQQTNEHGDLQLVAVRN